MGVAISKHFSRQPVHTLYGGADLFRPGVFEKLSAQALSVFELYAPDATTLETALTGEMHSASLWSVVWERVREKLRREAIEDYRIDFEDGYGNRPDLEEDNHATEAALVLGNSATLPPFIGIRIKPLQASTKKRSVRTLELFLKAAKKLPRPFIVTLPKVTSVVQITELVRQLALLEKRLKLPERSLLFDFMVETPESLLDDKGRVPLRGFVAAGRGRCLGASFGTYDFTASLGIVANYQHMRHSACDFAKHLIQASLCNTGIFLSDGATTLMPAPPHRGTKLSDEEKLGNVRAVHAAWRESYVSIRHSLAGGFFQGWDLHPAQLPVRYAAVYAFFLESLSHSTQRLCAFMDQAARATLTGAVFDDAATGQGLLNFFLRGKTCGALTKSEIGQTGLTDDELSLQDFAAILKERKNSYHEQTQARGAQSPPP